MSLCECGCGQETPLARFTSEKQRCVKGEPRRFVFGHWARTQVPKPTIVRFMSKVVKDESGCWLWTAKAGAGSYGLFWNGEKNERGGNVNVLAHRWAYQHFVGEIPEGLLVLHRCDVPACVNPDHLWLGTQADNMQDMIRKGRRPKTLSEAHRRHIGEAHRRRAQRLA